MKLIIYFITISFLFSCNSKDELRITLLNNKINSFDFQKDNRFKNKKTILKIKIENLSSENFIISNYCFPNRNNNCTSSIAFPSFNNQLDLNNLEIKNNDYNVKIKWYFSLPTDDFFKNKMVNDSIINQQYKDLDYTNDNFIFFNKSLTKNLIFIKSKEILYFETFIHLPVNYKFHQYIELSKEKTYNANLIINSDTTNIKKYLTWSQLKNIEENNYKLFHGTITSKNTVPIEFVD